MTKKRRPIRRRQGAPQTWWHGGVPNLSVGSVLKPPRETKTTYTSPFSETSDDADTKAAAEVRQRRVYITSDYLFAEFFACAWGIPQGLDAGTGWMYRVEPLDRLEGDPDDAAGTSRAVRRCKVVEVLGPVREMSPLLVNIAVAEHMTFSDGTPQFTFDGWHLVGQEWLARDPSLAEKADEENQRLYAAEKQWRTTHPDAGRFPLEPPPPLRVLLKGS